MKGNLTGNEPDGGYPVHLREWISRDGLNCLKIKPRVNDSQWDYERLVRIGEIPHELGVQYLSHHRLLLHRNRPCLCE